MNTKKINNLFPLSVIAFLLFLLGFVVWINNILVPFLEIKFGITPSQSQLVSAAFFGAHIISIPVAGLVSKLGYKISIIIGSTIIGLGCLIFIPALSIGYEMVLIGLFITAIGTVFIQVVANPYIIALGSPETSASRLTMTMAVNSIAASLAPFVGSYIISGNGNNITVNEEMAKLVFILLAATSIITGIIIMFINLPAIKDQETGQYSEENVQKSRSAWSYPHLILGFVAIGVYMGLEVGVGNYFVKYVGQNVAGLDAEFGSKILAFYPIGFIVGRLAGAGILKKFESSKVIVVNCFICVALLITFFITKGTAFSVWPLIAQGLFLSIMWSVLFDLSMKDIPASQAKLGSGIICTGIVFTGMWMWLMGKYVESSADPITGILDNGSAYIFFFLFYAYLIFFALKGSKIRRDVKTFN
jgi:FHS family L-fucose permease-like MFS transporter